MVNLIKSRFSRVFKSRTFYLSIAILFFIGFAFSFVYNRWLIFDREYYSTRTMFPAEALQMIRYGPFPFTSAKNDLHFSPQFCDLFNRIDVLCEEYIRYSYTLYGAITAIFISILIGKDFEYGTIRNKMIAGYGRKTMYLADLIVCILSEIIMQIVYIIAVFIPIVIIYFLYLGTGKTILFAQTLKYDLIIGLIGLALLTVYSSIYLFITYLSGGQAKAIIACSVTFAVLLLMGMLVDQKLYPFDYITDASGADPIYQQLYDYETMSEFMEANRGEGGDLSDTEKGIYKGLEDILPTSQATIVNRSDEIPPRGTLFITIDLSLSVLITGAGLIIFSKKNIN